MTVTLWKDVNEDGKLDGGDTEIKSTVTGPDGYYEFGGVDPTIKYLVVETNPAIFLSTDDKDHNSPIANGLDAIAVKFGASIPPSGNDVASQSTYNDFFDRRRSADLQVTEADFPDPVISGVTLTYTLSYTNAGPITAQKSSSPTRCPLK